MSRLLPPPSLYVNHPIMDISSTASELTPTRLGFPNEFPYEFDSPAFSPGFTTPGDSTETEDESSDDEEDFLAGLTRRLAPSTQRLPPPSFFNTKPEEKRQVAATSPQSTLGGLGSYSNSGSRSPIFPPSLAPRRDNAWDVISAAAGEVARLKLGSYESQHLPRQNPNPNPSPHLHHRQNAAFRTDSYAQQQRLLDQMWLCSQSRIKASERLMNSDEVTFENLRYSRHNALSNATWLPPPQHGGTPLKRPSAGTGVFLPRRYPTTPADSYKKSVNTTAMFQSKVNFEEPRHSQFDYECMFGRSTLLARQGNFRAVGGVNCLNERLPQDWMY